LFITGLIGIFGLWSFSCAFSVGGAGFFCVMSVCCFLRKIRSHRFNFLVMWVWYLFVGSMGMGSMLFSERKALIFLWCSCSYIMTVVFPLSARVTTALFLLSLLCMFFAMCSCRLCLVVVVIVVVVSVAYLCEFFGCHEAVYVLNLGVWQLYCLFRFEDEGCPLCLGGLWNAV